MCNNCRRRKIPCERRESDGRSTRLSLRDVDRLRAEVDLLHNVLAKVKDTLRQQAPAPLTVSRIHSCVFGGGEKPQKLMVLLQGSAAGSFSVFGPTLAFHSVLALAAPALADTFDTVLLNLSLLMFCLSNFFRHQYPDLTTFIHRESFLGDFLNLAAPKGYCSEELIYAVAALGAKSAADEQVRLLAPLFFETSRSKIFSKKVLSPHVSTLQALLCLALYELGDGNASASWMLLGMAFRMGYDLGFQLNPAQWATDGEPLPDLDVSVRLRIYWGCYVADHFVSLVMGRPVTMRKLEALIPSSEHLPNVDGISQFIYSATAMDPLRTLTPMCQLSEIAGAVLLEIYTGAPETDAYNSRLREWRRLLPADMRWNAALLHSYNPTLANFRLYYYVVVLCVNRPFLERGDAFALCSLAIAELAICLGAFVESGLPSLVLLVYCAILGISVLLMKAHARAPQPLDVRDMRVYFAAISRMCASWNLAAKLLGHIRKVVAGLGNQEVSQVLAETCGDSSFDTEPDEALFSIFDFAFDV